MKIHDISQEVFTCAVYPGDMPPGKMVLETMEDGSIYNLTGITMCAHNGTHVDAPYHFYKSGKTVDQISLDKFIGKCYVSFVNGDVTEEIAGQLIQRARSADEEAAKKILIGGNACITVEAARFFSKAGMDLVGNESQSVGPVDAPAQVHYELLKAEIVLLEGIRLGGIKEGVYWLNAAPVNLGGADGAPCRAVLIES